MQSPEDLYAGPRLKYLLLVKASSGMPMRKMKKKPSL